MAELLEFRTIWNVAMPGDSLVWETWIYALNKQGFYLSTFIIKFNFTKRQILLQWIHRWSGEYLGKLVDINDKWPSKTIIKNPIALFTSKWLVHLGNKQLWAGKQSETSRSTLFDNLRKSNWNYDTFLFSFLLIRTVTLTELLGLNRSEYLFHNSTPEKHHQQSETFEKNKKMFFSPTSRNYNWAEHIAELDSFFVLWGEEQKNAKSRRWMSLLTFGLRVQ